MKKYDKNSWWTHGSCRIHNEIKTAQKLFLKYVWVSKSKLKMRRNLPFCDLIQKCNPTLRSHSPLVITSFQADLRKLQNKDILILASAAVAMWRQIIQDTNVTMVASLVDNVLKHTEVENLLKLFAYDIYSQDVIVTAHLIVCLNLALPSRVQCFLSCPGLCVGRLLLGLLNLHSSSGGLDLLLLRAFRVETFPSLSCVPHGSPA